MSKLTVDDPGNPSVEANEADDTAIVEARKIVSHQTTVRPHLIAIVESDKSLLAVAQRILNEGKEREREHTWPLNPVHVIAVQEYVSRERLAVALVHVLRRDLEARTGDGV